LIDVVNELAQKYGPKKSFKDATFFDEFVDFTHPEIEQFMNSYIKNGEELPLKEYFQKIGVKYNPEQYLFELDKNATNKQVALRNHWMKAL
jgi:predicted metalloprotease with PDZ domain